MAITLASISGINRIYRIAVFTTIIILVNDNGGTNGVDIFNAGMRGRKGHTLYGGIRALSFWCWPEHWNTVERDQMTGHVDVLPAIGDIAKIDLGKRFKNELDGVSLLPLIQENRGGKWEELYDERMLVYHRARWNESPELTGKMASYYERWWDEVWSEN